MFKRRSERSNRPGAANRAEEALLGPLWQSGMRSYGRPILQWCEMPASERGPGWRHRHWWIVL